MAETKTLHTREYRPSDPRRRVRKINEYNRKGLDNPYGQEIVEVALADFPVEDDDYQENLKRRLEEEEAATGDFNNG